MISWVLLAIYIGARFYVKDLKRYVLFLGYVLVFLVGVVTSTGSLEGAEDLASVAFLFFSILVFETLFSQFRGATPVPMKNEQIKPFSDKKTINHKKRKHR